MRSKIFFAIICFLGNQLDASTQKISLQNTHNDVDADEIDENDDDKADSIWDSYPVEIDGVNVQILDKISGKVFRRKVKLNEIINFGNIFLKLKRCFKNSPEDSKEIYAYIEVYENRKKIFSNWKFASHQSVNLLEHPVYDIKIEF
ncbi:MAG: DUF2155 domain-containing protein [Holosporaceae bacterium]|jgi:hypothetical protein|nr:DUF2155 domain-containing protein [Holosporaceae bacterium]